jgi:hypothetical protein
LLSDDAGDENGDVENDEDAGGGGGTDEPTTAASGDSQGAKELPLCFESEGAEGVEAGEIRGKLESCEGLLRNTCIFLLLLLQLLAVRSKLFGLCIVML